MNAKKSLAIFIATAALAWGGVTTHAQSFMLDDNPQAPLLGFPGFGAGAENPWGFPLAPGTPAAPSPLLPIIPGSVVGDGDIIGTGPVTIAAPALPYMASLSDSAFPGVANVSFQYQLYFSVDRVSVGIGGSALNRQAALNQQPADVFFGGSSFVTPARFIGSLAAMPVPFAGVLPSVINAIGSNALDTDESVPGLPADASGIVLGPLAIAAPLGPGTHNNIDGFDYTTVATAGLFTAQTYQTGYPDLLAPFGLPTADIFDIAPGSTTFCGFPAYATGAAMGLVFGDVIDAMVVFDTAPVGSVACGGPGAQRGIDGVLFSLAPGSPSLIINGLNPGDVFLSDHSGNFAVYASAPQLGVLPNPGGLPTALLDNIDGLEFGCLGDLNHDGIVAFLDIGMASACVGTPGCADVNASGTTDIADLNLILGNLFCTGG